MNVKRFIKDWTLAIAMSIGAVVYLVFSHIAAWDRAGSYCVSATHYVTPLLLFLILFVTFCKVDFRQLRPVRWHLWILVAQAAIVSLLVVPILVFHFSSLSLVLLQSLIACAICPCASAAAVVTQKLGGKLESMTTFTFLSNLVAVFTIPLCFPLINDTVDVSFLDTFFKILYDVCVVLLLPMLCAYIVKHYMIGLYRFVTGVKDLSFYLWAFSLIVLTGTTVRNIVHANADPSFLTLIALCSLALCLFQFGVGHRMGHRFDSVIESGQSLGQKNTVFAIWATYSYLSPLASIGPGCYILWQNIINSLEIRKQQHKS